MPTCQRFRAPCWYAEEDPQFLVDVANRAAPKFKHRIADYYKRRGIYAGDAGGNEGGMVLSAGARLKRVVHAAGGNGKVGPARCAS
jgi:hypothetical protein